MTTKTWTVQYCEGGANSWDYVDAQTRGGARFVFARFHPKARILAVREN